MITPRLEMILTHIYTRTVADIGTDHAYIPINLVQNNRIDKAIATDLREGPLNIAKANINKYNISDKIELRLGGGISPVKEGEVESVIIAGMGGELIRSILDEDKTKAGSFEYLVLQPMNSRDTLRKWLFENGFGIVKEDIALEEYKVYNLIIAKKGIVNNFEDEFEFHVPGYLHSHQYFCEFKEKKKREFTKIKNGLEKASCRDEELIDKYTLFLDKLERI